MKVAFRVDASEALGTGHLMRCLALADAIDSQGGRCTFFLRNINHYASRFLNGTIHDVCSLDIDETSTVEEDASAIVRKMFQIADWLVVDHYGLDARWERVVRANAKYILVLDDLADRPHDCDLLVDPGLGRQVSDYAGWMERRAELLLGTKYAILKPSFAHYHNAAPVWPTACRAHVFFGGGSSVEWLPTYVKAMLDAVPTLSLFALGYAEEKEMASLIDIYGSRLKWRRYVEEMAGEYSQCDIAIGSPGTATWERACIGLPSALIATANNQIPILHDLDRLGFCRYLGAAWEFDELKFMELFRNFLRDKSLLLAMRALGVSSVDGNGAQRIVQKLFFKRCCDA